MQNLISPFLVHTPSFALMSANERDPPSRMQTQLGAAPDIVRAAAVRIVVAVPAAATRLQRRVERAWQCQTTTVKTQPQ